jgi:4-aminobutyrate aminotransferase/(S)-3-amino-2-methylpropionate transaminase
MTLATLPADTWASPCAPALLTPIPGPQSRAQIDDLARYECPAITARRARREAETGVDQDPIVWERALGAHVWDVDGNRYVDLTGAFAVASVGHNHPRVVQAAQAQAARLCHAMGDVYPSQEKIALCRKLAQITPGDLQHVILGLSGASAVEAALKTAVMATGKPGVIAFRGSYHGLSYGALSVTAYKKSFRAPFKAQLNPHVVHAPYPGEEGGAGLGEAGAQESLRRVEELLTHPASGVEEVGAIIAEPIQGRGGDVVAPLSWLRGLRALCDRHGLVLILDEIYTGLGRTGRWFACERAGVVPDVLCVGKALGGGAPISAAIGRPWVMRAWGESRGEAIHTSTFLGNPLGCAMALAALEVIEAEGLVRRAATLGAWLRSSLGSLARRVGGLGAVRGEGMMLGLPVVDAAGRPDTARALALVDQMRARGYLILPGGVYGHVIGLSPPLVISRAQLSGALEALEACLREGFTGPR